MGDILVTGFFQLKRTLLPGPTPVEHVAWVRPSGFMEFTHHDLEGILPDDLTFIHNNPTGEDFRFVALDFKVADLPFDTQIIKLHYRIKATLIPTDCYFDIFFSNDQPIHGSFEDVTNKFHKIRIAAGFFANDFTTFTANIPVFGITNMRKIWVSLVASQNRFFDDGFGSPLCSFIQLSWFALEVTFVIGAEEPVDKSYIDDLDPIGPLEVVAVGDKETTKWAYRVIPCSGDDCVSGCGKASDEVTVLDGNDVLDDDNFNCITWADVEGANCYKVYRTFSGGTPSSTGLIGTVIPGLGECGNGSGGGGVTGIEDKGLPGGEEFDESMCEDPTTVTFPAKETPS